MTFSLLPKLQHFTRGGRWVFKPEIFALWASLVALVKNLPAIWETQVPSPHREDPLEEGIATHSGILAWKNPMDRGASVAIQRVSKSWRSLKWLSTQHTCSLKSQKQNWSSRIPTLSCRGGEAVMCNGYDHKLQNQTTGLYFSSTTFPAVWSLACYNL